MAEIFPPTLSQCFIIAGFSYQQVPNTIRSEVEVGIAKVRRRYTKAITNITGSMVVDQLGVNTFQDFYDINLQSGVRRFIFQDPITKTDKEYRFISPPVIVPTGVDHWQIEMELEMLT